MFCIFILVFPPNEIVKYEIRLNVYVSSFNIRTLNSTSFSIEIIIVLLINSIRNESKELYHLNQMPLCEYYSSLFALIITCIGFHFAELMSRIAS